MTLRHLDLFSGIGGFALAAAWAGFSTIGFSEVDRFCGEVLKKHWPHVPNYGDVKNISVIENLDLITGGFPCQPFSNAGKKKGSKDARHLWPEFHRIINTNHPRFVVAENVAGIVDMELDNILDDLENSGYETQSFIIPASAVYAPHRRERLWIVAHSLRERRHFRFNHSDWESLRIHWERDLAAVQEKWTGFFPQSWKTFNFQKWFRPTSHTDRQQCSKESTNTQSFSQRPQWSDDIGTTRGITATLARQEDEPPISGVDDGLPNIMDRNKALGNAIVPQVVYPILRLIALMGEIENDRTH